MEENLPRYAENLEEFREAKEESESYFSGVTEQCRKRGALKGIDVEATIVAGHRGGTSEGMARMAHCSVLVVK